MPENLKGKNAFPRVALYSSVVLATFLVGQRGVHANEIVAETTTTPRVTEVTPTSEPAPTPSEEAVVSEPTAEEAAEASLPSLDVNLEALPADESANEFASLEVTKLENVALNSSNKRLELSEEVRDSVKESTSGTIYVEYNAQANGFFNLFATSSQTHKDEYTALFVNNGTAGLESRTGSSGQRNVLIDSGTQRAGNGEWNAIALTYQKNTADNTVDVNMYVNGQLSKSATARSDLFGSATALSYAQLGEVKRANTNAWAATKLDIRNFTLYNRALTAEEVARRSSLFVREDSPYVLNEGSELTDKVTVFEGGRGNRKNPDNNVASFRIPALLKTDKGTLIAASDQRHDHSGDWGNIAQVIKRSTDNGKQWSDTIKIVDLKDNPNAQNRNVGAPLTIDTALVQDPTTKRIFAIYDMFPEGQALFGNLNDRKPEHSVIDGKTYLNLYRGTETDPYTVREDGRIYDAQGQATEYRVNVNDSSPAFANLGDIYQGEGTEPVGNIYFQTQNNGMFRVAMDNYIWLSYSDDDGVTWSRPRDITASVKKEYMKFLGLGPGTGIVLHAGPHKGRLVVPAYGINYTGALNSQSAMVFYSDDHGETWSAGETFNDNRTLADGTVLHASTMNNGNEIGTEATIVQLSNGQLKMFMRGVKGKVRVATSLDGGATWQNDLETLADVHDAYVQLSAIRVVRDGKEYVLLANANGPGRQRIDGHVRVAEVGEDGSLNWLHHQILQHGEFAYNSIQELEDGTFGLLYEHKSGDQNAYSLYYRQFNWEYLTQEDYGLPTTEITTVDHYKDGYVALTFSKPVLAVNQPRLLLTNGNQLEFVSQLATDRLLFRINPADRKESIVAVVSGDISNIAKLPLSIFKSLDGSAVQKIKKVDGRTVRVTGQAVFEDERGYGLANLMDGDKSTVTELKWLIEGQPSYSLPQTITLTLPTEKTVHSMVISKRTPGNGTMTKYQVKAYLGDQLQFDSGERSVDFATAEVAVGFGKDVRADRIEFIPLEAHTNATTKDNRMWTVREVQLFEVVDTPTTPAEVETSMEFRDERSGVLVQLEEALATSHTLAVALIDSDHAAVADTDNTVLDIQLKSAEDQTVALTAPAILVIPKVGDKVPAKALLLLDNNEVVELDVTESPVEIDGVSRDSIVILTEQLGKIALIYPAAVTEVETPAPAEGGEEQPTTPVETEELVTAKGEATHFELPAFEGGLVLNENLTHFLPSLDPKLLFADKEAASEVVVNLPAASKDEKKATDGKTLPNTGTQEAILLSLTGLGLLGGLAKRRKQTR
ncbi:TPA: sialidase domain-containing protein [Streptococcus suis]